MRLRRWLAGALLLGGCNLVRGPPRESECRANLRTILSGEQNLHAEQGRFSVHPAEVGFAPVPGNRYLYLFAPDGGLTRRDGLPSPPLLESVGIGPDTRTRGTTAEWLLARFPAEVRAALGVHGACPACSVTIACAANLDGDDDVDVWSIASEDRVLDGGLAPRGTPVQHRRDLD
jgi:type IV pilus assembly protein PilA